MKHSGGTAESTSGTAAHGEAGGCSAAEAAFGPDLILSESAVSVPGASEVQRLLGLPVAVRATLAEREMPLESILRMTAGTIIEFDVPFDSPLRLEVGDRTIGKGVAVKVGETFGLRVGEIDTVRQRIDAMRRP